MTGAPSYAHGIETPDRESPMPRHRLAWRRILRAALPADHLKELAFAGGHGLYLRRHRAEVIIDRVRLVSAAFAVLTAVWIGVDLLTFAEEVWAPLVVLRLVSCAVFVALALPRRGPSDLRRARAMLAVMLANPMAFFIAAEFLFVGRTDGATLTVIVAALYEYLPFIALAGLSVFPLVAAEAVAYGLAVFAATLAAPALAGTLDLQAAVPAAWVMLLIASVYVLAGVIQVHYMMALVHRLNQDVLTGAVTRRSGIEIIDLYFHISLQHDQPFALAFLDLDRFKPLNDDHGHEAGDEALRGAAETLRHLLRRSDLLIRWGGEEFVLVLPGTDADGTKLVVQRILDHGLGRRPEGAPLTASIGLAERRADAAPDWRELVELADRRMYEAKNRGRNRCMAFNDEMLLPAAVDAETEAAPSAP